MDGAIKNGVEARYQFKDREFCLLMSIENNEILIVQAEDESSGDQWLGRFDSNCKCFAKICSLCHRYSQACNCIQANIEKSVLCSHQSITMYAHQYVLVILIFFITRSICYFPCLCQF